LNTADPNLTENDYQDWYVLRRIGSIGLLWNRGSGWMGVPATSVQRSAALKRLVDSGEVLEVTVDGIDAPFYMRTHDKKDLDNLLYTDNDGARASFIAPLDNLMWDRQLLEELFGFYYRWEVYVPPKQRKYGYYVLPVLYGDQFVARFEPVRNKKTGALTIVNWWWEQDIQPTQDIIEAISDCFEYFSTYLNITQVSINGFKSTDIDFNRLAIVLADMALKG
jgi:uncharacterized protein YcaQ